MGGKVIFFTMVAKVGQEMEMKGKKGISVYSGCYNKIAQASLTAWGLVNKEISLSNFWSMEVRAWGSCIVRFCLVRLTSWFLEDIFSQEYSQAAFMKAIIPFMRALL